MRQSPSYPFLGVNVPDIHVGEPFRVEAPQSGGGGNSNLFSVQQEQGESVPPVLVKLIKTTVAPSSWNDADHTLAMQGDLLIVSQTQEQQARIEQLLKDMRAELRPRGW